MAMSARPARIVRAIDPDLDDAVNTALREMILYLVARHVLRISKMANVY